MMAIAVGQETSKANGISPMRLVLTPRPHATECISGYLHRLSEANGYPSPTYITRPLKRSGKLIYLRLADPQFISDVAGVDIRVAERLCFRPENIKCRRTMRLLGRQLHVSEARMDIFRVCPLCVAAHGRHEAAWHLKMLEWCPTHRVRLLDRCEVCANDLVWNRPSVGKCGCGADLTIQGGREECPESLARLLAAVSAALYGDKATPQELLHLGSLDLYWICRLVTILCREVEELPSGQRDVESTLTHERLSQVADVLDNWPENFRGFLKRRYEQRMLEDRGDGEAFRRVFSWAFSSVGKNLRKRSAMFDFVREEVLRFGAQYLSRERLTRGDRVRVPVEVRWGSILEAASLAGIDPRTLSNRIKNGEVPHLQTCYQKRNRNVLVDLDWIRRWKVSRYRAVDPREAAEVLEISPSLLKALRAAGIFRAEFRTARPQGYAEEDVETFGLVLRELARLQSTDGSIGGIGDGGRTLRNTKSISERVEMLGALMAKYPGLWDGVVSDAVEGSVEIEVSGHLGIEVSRAASGDFLCELSNGYQFAATSVQELVQQLYSSGFSAADLSFASTGDHATDVGEQRRKEIGAALACIWSRGVR